MADVVVFKSVEDYEQAESHRHPRQAGRPEHRPDARRRKAATPPKVTVRRVPPQLDAITTSGPHEEPVRRRFMKMPDSIPAAERARLQAAARDAITKTVVPSYTKLKQYVVDDTCRRLAGQLGCGTRRRARPAMPGSRALHHDHVTPDEIHEIGLKEVARIRGEMMKAAKTGFKGSFDEFLSYCART
ncbi:MAG: DUF885 family protein [Proteobacteria bacterium]|nr:DUF885 family protein [Pseudomonadota bacterium]